jgi:hypothetical protein
MPKFKPKLPHGGKKGSKYAQGDGGTIGMQSLKNLTMPLVTNYAML